MIINSEILKENPSNKELNRGSVSVAIAAKVLGVDPQTVRLLLQTKTVDWGICYKRPGSRQFSYLIYAEPFKQLTGYDGGRENDR